MLLCVLGVSRVTLEALLGICSDGGSYEAVRQVDFGDERSSVHLALSDPVWFFQ